MSERRVWKFELLSASVRMPAYAEVLTVGVQGESVFLWALVDPSAPYFDRRFVVHGTGHPITEPLGRFVGTAFVEGLVFHVWEAA